MVWRRLPTFLPNIPIRLLPFSESQQAEYQASGFLRTVAFKTPPSLSKVRPPLIALCQSRRTARGDPQL